MPQLDPDPAAERALNTRTREIGSMREHACVGGVPSTEPSWWAKDGRGIELCRVCPLCEDEKLARYRPEILGHYDQSDVDEPIEDDY